MSTAQELFDKLHASDSNSLLKKYLTKEVFDSLKDKKTKFGGTLVECIRSGCENPHSNVGVYACDPEGYTTFADLLVPVIKDYHKVDEVKHPAATMGDIDNLPFPDLGDDLIVSTRIRVGRSHDSFGFPPVVTKEDRIEMERLSSEAFKKLPEELAGEYFSLEKMSKEEQQKLTDDHFLFNDHDKCLRSAGGYGDWPTGRGIFFNKARNFLIWVNEEDHLRFISMQMGGNVGEVYKRLAVAVKSLESSGLSFARLDNLGYLTFCPTNLGTTLRASVHIKIPKLAASPDFKEFCDKYHLQARGIHGEHTESVGGVYDISNKRRLGLSEFDAVKEMYEGVKAIIEKEKSL